MADLFSVRKTFPEFSKTIGDLIKIYKINIGLERLDAIMLAIFSRTSNNTLK